MHAFCIYESPKYFGGLFSLYLVNFGAKDTHFKFFMENFNECAKFFNPSEVSELELLWQMLSIRHVPLLFVTATDWGDFAHVNNCYEAF